MKRLFGKKKAPAQSANDYYNGSNVAFNRNPVEEVNEVTNSGPNQAWNSYTADVEENYARSQPPQRQSSRPLQPRVNGATGNQQDDVPTPLPVQSPKRGGLRLPFGRKNSVNSNDESTTSVQRSNSVQRSDSSVRRAGSSRYPQRRQMSQPVVGETIGTLLCCRIRPTRLIVWPRS